MRELFRNASNVLVRPRNIDDGLIRRKNIVDSQEEIFRIKTELSRKTLGYRWVMEYPGLPTSGYEAIFRLSPYWPNNNHSNNCYDYAVSDFKRIDQRTDKSMPGEDVGLELGRITNHSCARVSKLTQLNAKKEREVASDVGTCRTGQYKIAVLTSAPDDAQPNVQEDFHFARQVIVPVPDDLPLLRCLRRRLGTREISLTWKNRRATLVVDHEIESHLQRIYQNDLFRKQMTRSDETYETLKENGVMLFVSLWGHKQGHADRPPLIVDCKQHVITDPRKRGIWDYTQVNGGGNKEGLLYNFCSFMCIKPVVIGI